MPPTAPRPRASDADRERLLSLLREHYAQGQLDLDDMTRRVGIVLAATYTDEAAAAISDLPMLSGQPSAAASAGSPKPGGFLQRRRHGQRLQPAAGWVPTQELFRDPSTRAITRVWIDPADLSRHYVPEPDR
jgi:hypothetical protein